MLVLPILSSEGSGWTLILFPDIQICNVCSFAYHLNRVRIKSLKSLPANRVCMAFARLEGFIFVFDLSSGCVCVGMWEFF